MFNLCQTDCKTIKNSLYLRRITYIKKITSTMINANKYAIFMINAHKNAESMFNTEKFKYSLS